MIEEALATAPIRVGRDTCLIPKAKLAHPHKWRRKPKGEREARYERYNVFRASTALTAWATSTFVDGAGASLRVSEIVRIP